MIRIGQKHATPENPIEHLVACHRRIEQRLDTLERAADWLGSPDENKRAEAQLAIASALRFLGSSGALHTLDEEESLFPRLLPIVDEQEREYVESLERQHGEVDEASSVLEAAIQAHDEKRYREAVAVLARLYRQHIASEDATLMTIARQRLSPEQISDMSREMRERRAANPRP